MTASAPEERAAPARAEAAGPVPSASPRTPALGDAALRVVAALALVARLGALCVHELRGVLGGGALDGLEVAAGAVGYVAAALVVGVTAAASFTLARDVRLGALVRGAIVSCVGLVVAVASPALLVRLEARGAFVLAAASSVVVLAAAPAVLRASHARALGLVLAALGLAGVARTAAHALAWVAGERASTSLYDAGRGLSTLGIVLEALAVLVTSTYLATRGGTRARLVTNGALVLACVLAFLGARAAAEPAPGAWHALLRGLVAVPGPAPLVGAVLGQVMGPASLLLAVVALGTRVPGVPVLLALLLVARAQPDVPFSALVLAAVAARSALLAVDARALWATLTPRR